MEGNWRYASLMKVERSQEGEIDEEDLKFRQSFGGSKIFISKIGGMLMRVEGKNNCQLYS